MEQKRFDMLCAGTVAAAIVNSNPFGRPDRALSPLDFVSDYKSAKKRTEREQTLEEQIAILTQIMGCGPGKVN